MRIITARYVLPITSEPIENGAVAIQDDSILDVGSAGELEKKFPEAIIEDFTNAAILPGFVNCHSHLEITAMRGALDDVEHDFTAWLIKLTSIRSSMSDEEIEAAAFTGAMEGAQAGVTCFGDIGRLGHVGLSALKRAGLRGIVFQETQFSPENRTAEEDFKKLIEKYEALTGEATDLVRVGLSPHAPYTVSSRLLEMIAQFSIIERVPITIHAAESLDEHKLLTGGTGIFVDVYEKYGVEWESPNCTSIEYLNRLGVLAARPLLAHCVTASPSDLKIISDSGSKIAHCPKSNAKFGHGAAPFEMMLDRRLKVGLGSDSVASNNICDLFEEARFAALIARNRSETKRFISAQEVLRAATLGGAEALGMDGEVGSLEVGKQADIAVVSLENNAQRPVNDVHTALVFSSNARDVLATFVAGKQVYERAGH
jgi:5-methylthioadenosine/S-adenosylhomocysteine deaminase